MENLNFAQRQDIADSLKDLLTSNQTDFIELANILAHAQHTNVIDLTDEVRKQNYVGAFEDFGQKVLGKFYVFIKYTKKSGQIVERFGYMNFDYDFAGGTNNAKDYGYITYFDLGANGWRNCMPHHIIQFVVIEHVENLELELT